MKRAVERAALYLIGSAIHPRGAGSFPPGASLDTAHHQNALLAALGDDLALLLPDLNVMRLEQGEVLCESDGLIGQAYFPLSGVISMVTSLEDGSDVEVCLVGRRGGVGLLAALEPKRSFTRDVCQVPGEVSRIEISRLRVAYGQSAVLRTLVFRQMAYQLGFVGQSGACNARHLIEQRLCRWLLTCCDAACSDTVPMTQEFISYLLGVRRTTVTIAAGELNRRGLIKTVRGRVTLLDRAELEALSCECYGVTGRYAAHYLSGDIRRS